VDFYGDAKVTRLGIASSDWAKSIITPEGIPAMGGAGWIRIGQYVPYLDFDEIILGTLAFKRKTGRLCVADWDQEIHGDLDILIMQRYMNRTLIGDMAKSRQRENLVIVQDIDDWYWGISKLNSAWKQTHPAHNPDININHYKKVVVASDYVTTSTPYLAERLSSFFPSKNIHIYENCVDFSRYTPRKHEEEEKPLIGWFGSTAHRSGDLHLLQGVLSQIEDQFGFVHVGDMVGKHPDHSAFHEDVGIKEESMVQRLPLMQPADLYEKGFDYDIGIVPLVDLPFNRSKSWIKGLEYVAAGIPFIASPLPEYKRLKEEYGVGRIAKRPGDWLKHFNELRDPGIRQEEADKNLAAVRDHLDIKNGAAKLNGLLKSFL
jgi:glycosyltransferase involved in cell wall biosynthesis